MSRAKLFHYGRPEDSSSLKWTLPPSFLSGRSFQHLAPAQQADWGNDIKAVPVSSPSPQQVDECRRKKVLFPGVSRSPTHTFPLRSTAVKWEGNGRMGPGNSLIPTQLHRLQGYSLYWDGLIPGTTARGPVEGDSFCYQNIKVNVTTGDHVTSRRSGQVSWSDLVQSESFSFVLSVFRSTQQIVIMDYGWIDHFMSKSL